VHGATGERKEDGVAGGELAMERRSLRGVVVVERLAART